MAHCFQQRVGHALRHRGREVDIRASFRYGVVRYRTRNAIRLSARDAGSAPPAPAAGSVAENRQSEPAPADRAANARIVWSTALSASSRPMERKWTTPFLDGRRHLRNPRCRSNHVHALAVRPSVRDHPRSAWLFATQAVVLRATARAKNEPSSRLR